MLSKRVITTSDLNFIKTQIELNHEEIVEIVFNPTIERLKPIVDKAKEKNILILNSKAKDLRMSMTFHPQEIRDINFLEKFIFNKEDLFFLILDRIQDPQNLGSIFRSSLGANVDAIIIPNKNSCRLTKTVREVSKGATELIPMISVPNLMKAVKFLGQNNFKIYSCSSLSDKNFFEENFQGNLALIFGSENDGVSKNLEDLANQKLRIPMDSRLESLNVSNATSVILFEVFRQREL